MDAADLQIHAAGARMGRHRHAGAYAAVVLRGGYVEAGDRGRFVVTAGQVVIHGRHEAHMDVFMGRGAMVLNLPVEVGGDHALATLDDPDAVARAAERDPAEAGRLLARGLTGVAVAPADWVDRLAADLRADPALGIGDWADLNALAPETLSRGFRRAYGVTPRAYRAEQRALAAVRALTGAAAFGTLADVSAGLGFADQAHMTRAVLAVTGQTPGRLRVNPVQAGSARSR